MGVVVRSQEMITISTLARMQNMKLRNKSKLLITISTLAMAVVFAAISLYTYRTHMMDSLHEQGEMAAEMIRLTTTHEMVEGNPQHNAPYLKSLTGIPGLQHAHVIPAKSVVEQYDIDVSLRDQVHPGENEVLSTGKPFEEVLHGERVMFHYTLPYLAVDDGRNNCLSCHVGSEGDVLGAISLEIDVTEQYQAALRNTVSIVILMIAFGLVLGYVLRRFLEPIERTTRELQAAVAAAEQGDFSQRIEKLSDDEVGDIADRTNHLMETLEQSIGSIAKEVDDLIGAQQSRNGNNLLESTASVVHTMAVASRFKQVIENDRDLNEVYHRLQMAMEGQFGLKRYSYYEVSNSKNRLKVIFSGGLPSGKDMWCSKETAINCDFCRAKRTAQVVSSASDLDICSAFDGNGPQTEESLHYLCVPLILSGTVGGVLQVVSDREGMQRVQAELPALRKFIDEAAPVIEAKRLMQSLRDSSMRDPLTGLYNRRFLEEYVVTMTSGVRRRGSQLGILMCDVDHFKQVNDTLGHEVGDDVLKGACAVITHAIRESDMLVRYGGEEFMVVLLDTDEEHSLKAAERIRAAMESHKFSTTNGPMTKTLSIGLSMYPSDDEDFWRCTKFADVALYDAKESGRNRVVRFEKLMWDEAPILEAVEATAD